MTDHSRNSPAEDGHVVSLDLLRAVASLAVCWFHFTWRDDDFLPDGMLRASGQYGWLGVETFFVVSGFVIPWSLQRGGYRLKHYGRFLLKRVIGWIHLILSPSCSCWCWPTSRPFPTSIAENPS